MDDLDSIKRIRNAFAWMRKTGNPLADYPKRTAMTEREQFDARAFATGNYPEPMRWTRSLVELARGD